MAGRPEPRTLPRLYAILDVEASASRGIAPDALIDAWLTAGVRLIQLRAKSLSFGPMLALADRLAPVCASANAIFIVNDRADVARLCGARGVHVGQEDLSPVEVRRVAPDLDWVGLSTHTEAQWTAALEAPVDYLAAGPVYATTTKTRADDVIGLDGVRRAARAASVRGLPLVAIGGITRETAAEVIEAGAASVAVIADLLAPPSLLRANAQALLERLGGASG